MANDRLLIKCKHCGAEPITFAKYYPTWFTGNVEEGGIEMYASHADNVRSYIAIHSKCHPRLGALDLHGDPGFVLVTDSSDGGGG